jgi:hypothetical protein
LARQGMRPAWPFNACWLVGTILSATDPVAVVALLKDLGAEKALGTMIEGESLLNDGSAIVLYGLLYNWIMHTHGDAPDRPAEAQADYPGVGVDMLRITAQASRGPRPAAHRLCAFRPHARTPKAHWGRGPSPRHPLPRRVLGGEQMLMLGVLFGAAAGWALTLVLKRVYNDKACRPGAPTPRPRSRAAPAPLTRASPRAATARRDLAGGRLLVPRLLARGGGDGLERGAGDGRDGLRRQQAPLRHLARGARVPPRVLRGRNLP